MKNKLQKIDKNLDEEIKTEKQFMDLAYKTHSEISENVIVLAKQNFLWLQRVFGPQGLRILIKELDNPKLKEIKNVNEFKEQLIDLEHKAQIDALNKKYMVLISAIEAKYQEKLIQFYGDLIKRLTLDLRTSAIEMLQSEEIDYKETEEFKADKTKHDKMISIINEGKGRYFRTMKSLLNKFETDMNDNMKMYQHHLP